MICMAIYIRRTLWIQNKQSIKNLKVSNKQDTVTGLEMFNYYPQSPTMESIENEPKFNRNYSDMYSDRDEIKCDEECTTPKTPQTPEDDEIDFDRQKTAYSEGPRRSLP